MEGPGRPGSGRYLPAEDTHLLMEVLRGDYGGTCLEMGFGSGAVVASVAGRFDLAVGTDVVSLESARLSRARGVELVLADRATCFRERSFDLVFFNPPYLPSRGVSDVAVDGGAGGIEVPTAFLREALRVVRPGGSVLALLSDDGDLAGFERRCRETGAELELAGERKLFFERLVVYRLRPAAKPKAKRGGKTRR